VDEEVRRTSRVLQHVFAEGRNAEQVKREHPELVEVTDALLPGGRFQGKTTAFWAQRFATHFASYWERSPGELLALHGASDHVSEWRDHQVAAEIVNRAHPGRATAQQLPGCDHGFDAWPTEVENHANGSRGKFNPAIVPVIRDWVARMVKG
jgi:hypothetical protein